MQTEVIQDYINVAKFEDTIFDIYRNARESFRDDSNSEFLDLEYDDDTLHELAWCVADKTNQDMKKYLHQDDHRMSDNFANILDDYAYYRTGKYSYDRVGAINDRKILDAMIERLDAGVDSPRANDDRDYLLSWIFQAFGTFGFEYNFLDHLADAIYCYERETAVA